jgi:hypothetical protein
VNHDRKDISPALIAEEVFSYQTDEVNDMRYIYHLQPDRAHNDTKNRDYDKENISYSGKEDDSKSDPLRPDLQYFCR